MKYPAVDMLEPPPAANGARSCPHIPAGGPATARMSRTLLAMNDLIAGLASAHGGVLTRAQILAAGYSDRELRAAVREGLLCRLRQGCYSPVEVVKACDEGSRHLLHARAVLAVQRGQVALTGVSAALAHGLTVYGQDLSLVHLVRLDRGSARIEVQAVHHVVGTDLRDEVEVKDGMPVVSVARAVWEVPPHRRWRRESSPPIAPFAAIPRSSTSCVRSPRPSTSGPDRAERGSPCGWPTLARIRRGNR